VQIASHLLHAIKKGVQRLEHDVDDEEEYDEFCLSQISVAHVNGGKVHDDSKAA
jgi:hypothetical protein